jgi:serine/threonine protein kinase
MEERYEIKGKIGQGGLGAVYRAFDARMNREVAIKRILSNPGDKSITAEATKQLMQEAGSLASLQHPNIVTIYDVGTDFDGPFVVMEMLTGETLEELIGRGSFTWSDFRQLAMQTLEALIAAQELHIVHRDLKPGNIMLTWLPSGKFQVKIVDFGLAKLSAAPSLQTIDQSDGVFGSIYFMAPEQFERVPIDLRADLYAIGCVFYYALTGTYPYDGDTAAEVMGAHLQHHVTPLHEVREGIPLWACDWIMWHINRLPSDRPQSARDALKIFVENDEHASPPLSTGVPAVIVEQPKRPRLVIPGAPPTPEVAKDPVPTQPVKTAAAPIALTPPAGSKPSVHTTAQVVLSAPPEEAEPPPGEIQETPPPAEAPMETPPPAEEKTPVPVLKKADPAKVAEPPVLRRAGAATAPVLKTQGPSPIEAPTETPPPAEEETPVPVLKEADPAKGAEPPVLRKAGAATAPILKVKGSSTQPTPATQPAKTALAKPAVAKLPSASSPVPPAAEGPPSLHPPEKKRKDLSPAAKMVIATLLGILVVIIGVFALKKSGDNAEAKEYNEMIQAAAKEYATEVPVNKRKLEILLRNASSVAASSVDMRNAIYKALFLAKATDGTDIDARIAEFATTQEMIPDVREVIIRDVLRQRKNPAVIGTLLDFSRTTDEVPASVAAIEATRFMVTDEHFGEFLEIIKSTKEDMIRKAAEENAAEIISKSSTKQVLGQSITQEHAASSDMVVKHSLLRLLGRTGGGESLALAKEYLGSEDVKDKIAAIVTLGRWSDDSGLRALVDYLGTGPDLQLRARAYDSAYQFITATRERGTEELWTLLSTEAKTEDEQMKLIRGLANVDPAPWAYAMLGKFAEDSDYGNVIDLAERAIVRLKDIEKTQAPKPKPKEE